MEPSILRESVWMGLIKAKKIALYLAKRAGRIKESRFFIDALNTVKSGLFSHFFNRRC